MRTFFLLPLTAVVIVVAGCGSQERTEAALSVIERDLTLPAQAPEVEIASAVELQQPAIRRTTGRIATAGIRPAPRRSTIESETAAAPAPALALSPADTAARPVSTASEPANDRELPPGKTITVIPVSSGPSTAVDPVDEIPTVRGGIIGVRGGGRCPPRGRPGIGIATRPRPVLY